MAMPALQFFTAEMVRQLPDDGNRYETVHGELLVTPAPALPHQRVVRRLIVALSGYCEATGVGEVFPSPADISWGPDVLVQPDVFVARLDEARTLKWEAVQHLLLAVEVLSPSSGRADQFTKRRLYQEVGVPLYWMVDPVENRVEIWSPGAVFPRLESGRLEWWPAGAGEPFQLDLARLFQPA